MTGRDNPVSTSNQIVHWDAEWHYDPEGVTFERKVIGGHLVLLGLKQGGKPFAQYTYPIFEWARNQGAMAATRTCSFCLSASIRRPTASFSRWTVARRWNTQWKPRWEAPRSWVRTCREVTQRFRLIIEF